MPITAYSRHFKRELDVAQFLDLAARAANVAPMRNAADIPADWREWIKQDILCPSCGVPGAHIVGTSRSRATSIPIRQTHFRFDSAGIDAHHPFCEFSPTADAKIQEAVQVDFLKSRGNDTQVVRDLVCRAIANGLLSQEDIRDMRQWYFDTKVANRFYVTATESDILWMFSIRPPYPDEPIFHPCHAEVPGFDWKAAGRAHLMRIRSGKTLDLRGLYLPDSRSKALSLLKKYEGQEMFDVTAIEVEYKKTIALCSFIGQNFASLDISLKKRSSQDFPVSLLAFCAVLLFKRTWNFDGAVRLLVDIINAPSASDQNLGNVIGLNPFHDYRGWSIIKAAIDFTGSESGQLNFESKLNDAVIALKQAHAAWVSAGKP